MNHHIMIYYRKDIIIKVDIKVIKKVINDLNLSIPPSFIFSINQYHVYFHENLFTTCA
jgi:hypothetical protein